MTPTIVNWIFADALSKVSEYMQWPVWVIVGSILWITFFIIMIGLIMMAVWVFRK